MSYIVKLLEKCLEYAVYALIFIIPFSKAGIEIFSITAITAFILLSIISKLISRTSISLPNKETSLPRNQVFAALLIFIVVNIGACAFSVMPLFSFKALLTKTAEYAMLFFIAAVGFNDKKKLRNIIIVILISTGLLALDGCIQYLLGADLVRHNSLGPDLRLRGPFSTPNDFSNYLVVFAPVFFALFIKKNIGISHRAILLVSFILLSCCVFLSYTRASWLGFIFALLFFGVYKSRKLFLFFVSILIIGSFLLPAFAKSRLKETDTIEKISGNYRMALWHEALNIIEDRPVLGAGLNTYSTVAPRYKIHPKGGIYPHNSYLHMTAETGILGLLAFLWFVFNVFKTTLSYIKHGKDEEYKLLILGIVSGLFGFLVNAFFDTTLYSLTLTTTFWLICGVCVAACGAIEREHK